MIDIDSVTFHCYLVGASRVGFVEDRALDETRYSLQELTRAANVSVRTVRYYIAEGLLPPPVSAGARSFYGEPHLDRLRLIGLLKDSFLPLKEIRRRLTGLDDAAVRLALAELEQQDDHSDALFSRVV